VVAASAVGVLVANYHVTPAQRAIDPERIMITRFLSENINLGLYSYNATLPAVAVVRLHSIRTDPACAAL
jgi:hypothetical protein